MAIGEVADLAVRLSLDDKFSRGLKGASGQLDKFEGSMSRVGRGAGQLSSGLARAGSVIAVGIGAAGVGVAKAAIDFEDAFAGIKKTVSDADLEAAGLTFADLEKDIRDLAKTIPISATELARLGETAGALGVNVADIDDFVEVTAKLGVTTNLTADEAADAFGRIGTILNLTGDDYEELADSIVALGNAGASTESEITEITKRFAAEAKAAGIAKEDIVGLASVTASLGFAPERGGTALARVFANMGTNIALANKKGQAFAKAVGKPIEELQDAIDRGEGLPIFLDVLEQIKGMKPTEAAKFLKSIGVTNVSDRTIFRAMADQLPEVNRQLEIANTATGALSKEAQERFNTVASKIAVFKNNLIDAAITIGAGHDPGHRAGDREADGVPPTARERDGAQEPRRGHRQGHRRHRLGRRGQGRQVPRRRDEVGVRLGQAPVRHLQRPADRDQGRGGWPARPEQAVGRPHRGWRGQHRRRPARAGRPQPRRGHPWRRQGVRPAGVRNQHARRWAGWRRAAGRWRRRQGWRSAGLPRSQRGRAARVWRCGWPRLRSCPTVAGH